MSGDARTLVDALAYLGHPVKQDDLAYSLWGSEGSVRRVQAACQEARLAGWPIVSSGTGVRLETIPAAVAACADALRARALTQFVTARALRYTARRMREEEDARAAATLWPVES
jgi:hypothetical protein